MGIHNCFLSSGVISKFFLLILNCHSYSVLLYISFWYVLSISICSNWSPCQSSCVSCSVQCYGLSIVWIDTFPPLQEKCGRGIHIRPAVFLSFTETTHRPCNFHIIIIISSKLFKMVTCYIVSYVVVSEFGFYWHPLDNNKFNYH